MHRDDHDDRFADADQATPAPEPAADRPDPSADQARRIEREARLARGADLAGLLAGRDGGGHLAGASPTPALQRALLEVEHWLEAHLRDREDALTPVLLRSLAPAADLLRANLGRPQATVATWLGRVLERPALVADLVREADREWGRRYQERPHFERPGQPPDPDDPYTIAGVTAELQRLREVAAGQ
jgi:hypothetical protein